jgi:4-carboxymuconolactone decarboxylase
MNNTGNKRVASKKALTVAAVLYCASSVLGLSGQVNAQSRIPAHSASPPVKEIQMAAPALEHYAHDLLLGDVWERPDLSLRDRSIVTVAVLVARNQPMELPYYLNRALDNGVKPIEISEIITHLAFYSGWPKAMAAVNAAKTVFAERHIGADQLPPAKVELPPLDKEAEDKRAQWSRSTSARSRRGWSSTRPRRCSGTSGCALA